MKLSFIIPLYNAEAYIAECLDSILNSDIDRKEYEIIVIDDGSKDNGLAVVRQYEQKYDNITVLVQENQGQSVARNYGIREAKGEYIWCIDSDDYTDSKFSGFLNLLQTHPTLDIVAVKLTKIRENGEKVGTECDQPIVNHNEIMKGRDAVINGYNPSSVCALVARKALIEKNNLYFKEGITHQDVELSYRLMSHADDVIFTDYAPYIYVLHPNSTSQSVNPQKKLKYVSDDIIIIQSFRALASKFKDNDPELAETITNRSNNVLWGMVYSLRQNRKQWRELGIQGELIKRLKEAGMYPMHEKFDSWKKQVMACFLNFEWFIK